MGTASQGWAGRFSLAGFSLTLSVVTACFCQALEKAPQRKPRQTTDDEASGSRVLGAWSVWGTWSACSQPCGLGVMERTRACQAPYQRVPWAGRTELAPQPAFPSHPEERPASPYPARPAYPLHLERGARPALPFGGGNPVLPLHSHSQPPLAPQHRYTRHEDVPTVPSRDTAGHRKAPSGEAAQVPRAQQGREEPPRRALSPRPPHRVSPGADKVPSRRDSSARPPARESIPLFKPARWESQAAGLSPERPRHGSQADSTRHGGAMSPTQDSQAARRSRVRESIKPGKYGYGKLPFALPLHRDGAEGAAPRFKRHHMGPAGEPPPPPPPPPLTAARKQKRKAGRSTSREEAVSQEKEPLASGAGPQTPHEPTPPLATGGAAEPRRQVGEGGDGGSGHRGTPEDKSRPTEPGTATMPRSEPPEEGERRGVPAAQLPGPSWAPQQRAQAASPRGHALSEEGPLSGSTGRSALAGQEGAEGDGTSTAVVAPPGSREPSLPGSQSPAARGQLRLTHQVLRNHSSSLEQKGAHEAHRIAPESPRRHSESGSDRTGHANHPPRGQARSRAQRQNEPRPGSHSSRSAHSLFVDSPVAPRPAQPDIWLLHRGSPVQFHTRGQRPPSGAAEGPQWNLYYPGTETFHCEGENKQFKACRQEACPPERPDPRAVQCAAYNSQEFMGRFYQWEPFTDVRGSQRCELNCRPVGYRFYVRHTEKVQDGTPCEASSLDICVAGQCLTPGCDGILGSNQTLDSCGVCGGEHTTCKLVVGNFSDTDVPIGYHRILEIPVGATRIQVREMTRSPNYLALRSHSGKSIINGNWAVNPPGRYEAAGTVFVYSRPGNDRREGETLTADGPTTEPIDVYMIFQQDNPGVAYQFFLASAHPDPPVVHSPPRQEFGALTMVSPSDQIEPPTGHMRSVPRVDTRNLIPAQVPVSSSQSGRSRLVAPPLASSSQSGRSPGTLQRNVRVPPLPPPPPPPVQHSSEGPHDFYWKRVGNTECSATCGKGFWQSAYRCFSRASHEEVGDEKCRLLPKPVVADEACNTEPCPAYWDTGEWSACSKSCGLGTQHRQVLCRQVYANRSTVVHPQRCGQLEKPNATQACQVLVCSHWEAYTDWSSCSVLCGLGQRTRHVRCVSNRGDLLKDSDCPGNHRPKTSESCDMGPCVRTWFYSEWSNTCSAECGTGIQRRAVVCLSSNANGQVGESCTGTKPADMRACNGGPCQRVTLWYSGPWSQCSGDCSTGTQRRDVICVSKLGSDFNVTEASECAHLEKPPSLQSCVGTACEARWFSTAWSACSQSCVGGIQVREVQCLTHNKTLSSLCPPDLKPVKKRPCNNQPCVPNLDENCRDKYHNCPVIVQARLCVYSYYKAVCCASCTHALERRHAQPSR